MHGSAAARFLGLWVRIPPGKGGGQIVGLYWVPGHAGVRENEVSDKLARDGSVQKFVETQPCVGGFCAERKKKYETLGG